MKKIIVLTGGGSAGHVTPNLALVDDLTKNGFEVHYIGTQEGIERSLVKELPYHSIAAGKLRRYFSWKNVSDVFALLKGYRQSKKILRNLKPTMVFAKGGFVSVPVVWAAAKLNIPVVLHESDYTPGLANRLCMKKANRVCLSFDTGKQHTTNTVVTGSPIRKQLLMGNREQGLSFLGFEGDKPVLLIMGGSLGAKAINDVLDPMIKELAGRFDIVHLRGKGNLNEELENQSSYRQFEYLSEQLPDVYAVADIALSRAGANAVFEFLALHLPALLIPLPLSASRGDQILNAGYFEKNGFAQVLPQEQLTEQTLKEALYKLLDEKERFIENMKKAKQADGTQNVLNVIYGCAANECK